MAEASENIIENIEEIIQSENDVSIYESTSNTNISENKTEKTNYEFSFNNSDKKVRLNNFVRKYFSTLFVIFI